MISPETFLSFEINCDLSAVPAATDRSVLIAISGAMRLAVAFGMQVMEFTFEVHAQNRAGPLAATGRFRRYPVEETNGLVLANMTHSGPEPTVKIS